MIAGHDSDVQHPRDAFAALRQFVQSAPAPATERCELCGAVLGDGHPHLLEVQTRRIGCACQACAILFSGQQGGRYLRIPQRVRRLMDFSLSDLEWAELSLPIQLAYFYRNTDGRLVCCYPSPAGAVESELSFESLQEVVNRRAELCRMEPLVEALLVSRVGSEHRYFIASIDECYRLVGLIRTKWRGLSGGAQVWGAITEFFRELETRSGHSRRQNHA